MKTASFWTYARVFIGLGTLWKTRWGHASKIDAWLHSIAVETRQLPRICGNTRDIGPWFLAGGPRHFENVPDISQFWYFLPEYSSDVRKSLGSTYLLDDPLLGLQVM